MWLNTIGGGAAPQMTTQVFYTGTEELKEGYALFFDFNAADVNHENEALTAIDVGEEYWNDARRLLVEKCTEKNKIHFAGVVAKESDGFTGPGYVKIHRPGSICNVFAFSNLDHERNADGGASGQIVNPVVGQWYFMDGGFPGSGAAIILQDVDRSSTSGIAMAELMVGPPSGGLVVVAVPSASGSLSTQLSAIPLYAGQYTITQQTLDSAPILSTIITTDDGKWVGQKCLFKAHSTFTSSCVSVAVLGAYRMASTAALAEISGIAEISAANEFLEVTWTGVKWLLGPTTEVFQLAT